MAHDEIVRALRENADWCGANEYEIPLCMGDNQREAANLIESLQAQLAESQRREQAAVEEVYKIAACDACKHYDPDENACAKPMVNSGDCFEWRGPQEAEEGETNGNHAR